MSKHEIGQIIESPEGVALVVSKEEEWSSCEWSSCEGCYYRGKPICPSHTDGCSEEPNVIFKVVPADKDKMRVLKDEVHNLQPSEVEALIFKLVQEKRIILEEFSILCSINRELIR